MKKTFLLLVLALGTAAALSAQNESRFLILGTWVSEIYLEDTGRCVLEFQEGGRVIAHSFSYLAPSNVWYETNEKFYHSYGDGTYSFNGSSLSITLRINGFGVRDYSGPCRLRNGNYEFEIKGNYNDSGLFCGSRKFSNPSEKYYTLFRRMD
jgi:hypothetical protein